VPATAVLGHTVEMGKGTCMLVLPRASCPDDADVDALLASSAEQGIFTSRL